MYFLGTLSLVRLYNIKYIQWGIKYFPKYTAFIHPYPNLNVTLTIVLGDKFTIYCLLGLKKTTNNIWK